MFLGDASSIIGLQGALKFHGGGHINHSIFWQNLCPVSQSGDPSADLMAAIIKGQLISEFLFDFPKNQRIDLMNFWPRTLKLVKFEK